MPRRPIGGEAYDGGRGFVLRTWLHATYLLNYVALVVDFGRMLLINIFRLEVSIKILF